MKALLQQSSQKNSIATTKITKKTALPQQAPQKDSTTIDTTIT